MRAHSSRLAQMGHAGYVQHIQQERQYGSSRTGWLPNARAGGLQRQRGALLVTRAADPLIPLGFDFLTFLTATVLVIPVFKQLKISPVLGEQGGGS